MKDEDKHLWKIMPRRQGIIFLLEHWREIFDPDGTTATALGDRSDGKSKDAGDGTPLMPLIASSKSVKELCLCVQSLREFWPGHCAALMRHYLSEWKTEYVNKPVLNRKNKPIVDRSGRPVTEPKPVRRQLITFSSAEERAAHIRMVDLAIDFLCATYRLPHVVIELNNDLVRAALDAETSRPTRAA